MAEDKTRIFLSIRWNQLQRHPVMEMNLYNRIVSVVVEPPATLDPSLGGPGRAIMFDEDPVVSSRP